MRTKEQDPTNLYIANLPLTFTEKHLEEMLHYYGSVISTRILRDNAGISRGVGFARMEKTEICEKVIKDFNSKLLPGSKEALLVKFADSSSRRKKITGVWGAAAAALAAGVDPRTAGAELLIGYDNATQAAAAAAAAALMQQNALGAAANPFVSGLFPRYSITPATHSPAAPATHHPAAAAQTLYPAAAAAQFNPAAAATPTVATSAPSGAAWINPHATQYYLPTGSQFLPAHASSPEAALYGLSQAPSGTLSNPYASAVQPTNGTPQHQQQHAAHLANAGAPVAHLYGAVAGGFMPTSSIATYAAAAAAAATSPQAGALQAPLQAPGQMTSGPTPTSNAE